MAAPTYRSDRLFQECGKNYFKLAQKIERKDEISVNDVRKVDHVNRRCGDDITLLFHSVASGNLSAIDALLASGADVRMTDKAEGSNRDFIYFLTLPGGDLIDKDGVNEMIKMYLKYGGDPNARLQSQAKEPVIAEVALAGNLGGVRILLQGGADPWANVANPDANREANMMTALTLNDDKFALFDELIDEGYFDNLSQEQLSGFFLRLGGYEQRGDEISQEIQRITMRVLKRNQDYVQTSQSQQATAGIFKNHWQDPEPGVIPWDLIKSDAIR